MISKLIDPVLMIFVSRFEDDDGDAMVEESVFPLFEFCDWAEARREGWVGDSQRILRRYGYNVWRLQDYLKGDKPLNKVLTKGSEMLVGIKENDSNEH